MTTTAVPTQPVEPPIEPIAVSSPRGHIGRIVTGSVLGGLLGAVLLVTVPFAGAPEHVMTGSALLAFATAWATLAFLSERRTDQPQRWAFVPAALMGVAGAAILVVAPTGNEAGWIWPPAIVALAVWMTIHAWRSLRSRARALVLYPVFVALALSAFGGAYESYREAVDSTKDAMPGRLVDVGGHALHINCTGAGGPTVVLEAGLGEPSPMMAGWVAPNVAPTARVCVYDRAGRGWSESASGPQDGEHVATDLHTLLRRAGETGPFVLAGHSAGGIYVLNFAKLFPADVAGVVLLDSMHPEQYERMPSWPGFYEMYRRASGVMPALARLGVGRAIYSTAYADLPAAQRDQERAFLSTPRHNRSIRDEFNQIRTAMNQAAELQTLGSVPLAVVTAASGAEDAWFPMQDDLATLSSDTLRVTIPDATHTAVVENEDTARMASSAILDVVKSVRTNTPVNATPQPSSTTTTVPRPADLVDATFAIKSGRLHIHCDGRGPSTVLLIAGWDNGGDESWAAVQPTIAKRARVCTYDRFGTGKSDAASNTQTFTAQAADLHALLAAAGEPGPYVVAGHSFGGAEAVAFASQYHDEVVGLLLVDASPPTWPTAVCAVLDDGSEGANVARTLCATYHDPASDAERLDAIAAFNEIAAIDSLGNLPVTVITAAHRTWPGLAAGELTRLDAVWAKGVSRWAALSTNSTTVTVEKTGHYIQLEHPNVIVNALTHLLRESDS